MQILNILHLGPGNVGKEFLNQLFSRKFQIEKDNRIRINVIGIFNSEFELTDLTGLTLKAIQKFILLKDKNHTKTTGIEIQKLIKRLQNPLVVIDTTAADNTFDILYKNLSSGGFVILSNKKPLTAQYFNFQKLYKFQQRIFFETTVGAGLPVISTIKELLETGDKIIEIQGCFSGTLGYIFSQLEKGSVFSDIVKKAKDMGFTEPDPRDDLSGTDVGRKALILARLMGQKINLKDFGIQSLYPDKLKNITVDDFLNSINILDDGFRRKMEKARNQNCTLRYIASVSASKISVGLKQIPKNSDIGTLNGPDNIVVIKTNRYNKNPLIIKGPGAGKEVTACGVFGDLLKIIRIIRGNA